MPVAGPRRACAGWRFLLTLALTLAGCVRARAQSETPEPTPPPPAASDPAALEARLRRLEEINARLIEQMTRDRAASESRYRELEQRYGDLKRQLDEPEAADDPEERSDFGVTEIAGSAEETRGRASHLGRPGELGKFHDVKAIKLHARFADGFQLASENEEFDLRFHILDQTDFKVFSPNDRTFGKSGLYIPRVRVYFEGRLTKLWDYEVSLQRSLEGTWDLLDGNLNFHPRDGFQVKFGRFLVPYSYEWFDHLEQYFIAPERPLFALNFGLSRQAGLMTWGNLGDGKVDWAVGGFNGHLTGLADINPNQEAVGYLNFRPFLRNDRFPWLQYLNVGASGSVGEVARSETPLPLRTSVQAAENDEAANDASAVFLDFNQGVVYQGNRDFGAIHLAYYGGGFSFESEYNVGRFQMARPGLSHRSTVPVDGFHTSLSYFLTGEQVTRRTTVIPLQPFAPLHGRWGHGAFEPFARYSALTLGQSVFTDGLADPDLWTRDVGLVDLGLNWYPNRWMKFYLTWQHAIYGRPILASEAADTFGRSTDLFWIRCQLYY